MADRPDAGAHQQPAPPWGTDEVNAALRRMLVAEAMAGLPEAHRAVLSRAYYLGWTTGKIADDLGIAEGTVKSRLHDVLRRLRMTLAEMGCDTTPGT